MTEDIIARIDAALGCQYCRKDLDPDGPSPDFCGEPCRSAWHAKLGDPLPPVTVEGRPERVQTAEPITIGHFSAEAVRDYRPVLLTIERIADVSQIPHAGATGSAGGTGDRGGSRSAGAAG